MTTLRICNEHGCNRLTPTSRCPQHTQTHNRKRAGDPNRRYHQTTEHKNRKRRLLTQDGWLCALCKQQVTQPRWGQPRPSDATLDYITPLAHNGPKTDSNARILCRSCNSRQGATVRRSA